MTAEEVEALLYDKRNYGQVADGSTCQRIKLSRNSNKVYKYLMANKAR